MPDSYLAYCDESGQRDYGPKTDNYFIVASVLVKSSDASHLEDEIRGLKRTFWGRTDIEIKSNWIRLPNERKKHYITPYNVGLKEIGLLMDALYLWVRNSPIKVVAGIVDKKSMISRYQGNAHYPGAVAYTMFLQRFQKYTSKRISSGNVIFDDPSGKSPGGFEWRELLQRQHSRLLRNGCPYTGTEFQNIGTITFADSSATEFIQIADLVAYNVFRQFRMYGSEWESPKGNTLPLYEHFRKFLPLFDLGPNKQLAGYGISKWPVDNKINWHL